VPPAIRVPLRHDGKPAEAELRQLAAAKAEIEKQRMEKFNELKNLRAAPRQGFPLVDITEVC
jgi:enhancer of polycomb-like protein